MESVTQKRGLSLWVLAARPKTLWAAVAPVLIGTAMAIEAGGFHAPSAFFALLGAVLIQIGTNFSNDYSDFLKGADTGERKGPLRVTQAGLVTPEQMRRATALIFFLALLSGIYLIVRGGWPVLLIGVLSIVSGILYTAGRYSLAYLGLGDLFVLIFFGPVAVGGTYYVQTLTIEPAVLAMGVGAGLLSVCILLSNNIRDVEEDRAAGKKTLVVRFGRGFGVALYAVCAVTALLIPASIYLITGRHPFILLTLLLLVPAMVNVRKFVATRETAALNPLLGASARLLLIYSLVFSATWVI
jgi:1,4-dihydroxy-2-naphthoate octaprenyltransferase